MERLKLNDTPPTRRPRRDCTAKTVCFVIKLTGAVCLHLCCVSKKDWLENTRLRLHRAREGTCPSPRFYKWLGTGGTVSRRTANKKLTKLYCPSHKRSSKRLIVRVETKTWRGMLCAGCVSPTFKFVPALLLKNCRFKMLGLILTNFSAKKHRKILHALAYLYGEFREFKSPNCLPNFFELRVCKIYCPISASIIIKF